MGWCGLGTVDRGLLVEGELGNSIVELRGLAGFGRVLMSAA